MLTQNITLLINEVNHEFLLIPLINHHLLNIEHVSKNE